VHGRTEEQDNFEQTLCEIDKMVEPSRVGQFMSKDRSQPRVVRTV
jgi:hypothetical protein